MANVDPYSYGGECQKCVDGTVWFSPPPDRNPIWLCAEHEEIVANVPGWTNDLT